MPASATAGQQRDRTSQRRRWQASLGAKIAALVVIFVLVPVFLYVQFRSAYEESQELLLRAVRDEGRVISQSLLPLLKAADTGALPDLGQQLSRFAGEVTTIKLLLAPVGTGTGADGFYYVASWPSVAPANLEVERDTLSRQGVLQHLAQKCQGELPFSLLYPRPTGGEEIVTAITSVAAPLGCWAIVASFSADAFPAAHLGQPYWATPTVRFAALIYLAMAIITFTTLFGIRGGLRQFAERARRIREEGPAAGSFAGRASLPELGNVAAEFDRMVEALYRSAADIRRSAEDNAHAFKTPIAVIRQSLEPVRRALSDDNQRAQRAFGIVESSLDRLDALVASARRLDEAAADLIAKPHVPIDLARIIRDVAHTHSAILASRRLTLNVDLTPGLFVLGNEEMIETVLENLIDNAVSFSPEGGEIELRLERDARNAIIAVADAGPGVPGANCERIFERYYSERRAEDAAGPGATYFGIGLWIARRNVEAMGGTIGAENRDPTGLTIRVRLPLAPGRGT